MKRKIFLVSFLLTSPAWSQAGEVKFSQSGLAGLYYGMTQTRENNNINNLSNRLVFRMDGKAAAEYQAEPRTTFGLHANYTVVGRQHDNDYSQGDWRFYPYFSADNKDYGRMTAGYTYNASLLLHNGAREITWLGIRDTNLTYFLSNPNWSNKKHSTKFATPKSTAILNDGRALKFSYFTPSFGNTKFGFSYAPDNASRRGMTSRYAKYEKTQDGYVAAMQNHWALGGGKLETSAGFGIFNRTDKETSLGAAYSFDKLRIGIGYKKAYVDGKHNPLTVHSNNPRLPDYHDNFRESQAFDFSIGYEGEKFKSSLAYIHTKAENTRNRDDILIQSNIFSVNKWLDVFWVNSYLNSKGLERHSNANNKGYAVITGIALKY